jgi:rare lipoprotein A
MFNYQRFIVILCIALITACGGKTAVKKGADTKASQPAASQTSSGKGGYYLDDGPGDNAPNAIDSIPDAELKTETPLVRANKPYSALGQKYVPMTSYAPYTKQGVASWYGKRYHGKQTSSGEIYDMYGMSGAHTTLPIPSYVRVTNPENKRSVIVRINDRGPFKHDRLIDLSYAAAYKLRLTEKGSGLVEVEWIDTSADALRKMNATQLASSANIVEASPANYKEVPIAAVTPTPTPKNNNLIDNANYYVQVGAFKNEKNGEQLQKKILGLDLAGDAAVTNVYNDGIYRVRLGPFDTRKLADISANKVRKQLNMPAIVTNQ